jgi:hypothetical protein
MESKLASTLILALAILIGFSFVGFGEAKASEFNLAEFQPVTFSAVACCHPDFNNKAFKGFQFESKASLKVFAFTNPEFQGAETRSFTGNFISASDATADNFRAFEFKRDFAASSTNRADFAALPDKTASFNTKTFPGGDFFDSIAFSPSNFNENAFQISFEVVAFGNGFASFGCCEPVGFAGDKFQGVDGQFQSQG